MGVECHYLNVLTVLHVSISAKLLFESLPTVCVTVGITDNYDDNKHLTLRRSVLHGNKLIRHCIDSLLIFILLYSIDRKTI
jgi:hypothetical protein